MGFSMAENIASVHRYVRNETGKKAGLLTVDCAIRVSLLKYRKIIVA